MTSLENSTRKLLNKADGDISRSQVVNLAGWFRLNAPNDEFYKLWLKANGNHKKVVYDLRQKFPEVFSEYARFNNAEGITNPKVLETSSGSKVPDMAFTGTDKMNLAGFSGWLPVLVLVGIAWYFFK